MIKIIINGAQGKMGRVTVASIANEKDLQLVATTTRSDNLSTMIQHHHADVVIDFTTPHAVFENTKTILESNARAVIGTTGLTQDQIKILSQFCETKKIGCIIAPNFSIGAILLMKYAQDAAKYFPDVEIIECHHPQKIDSPSGTAKKTAELIAQNKTHSNTSTPIDVKLNNASRGLRYCDIPIHSVRMSGVFANQQIIFGGQNETLTLSHQTLDRNAIMPGVFLCCRKVMRLSQLVYGMENML